MLIRLTRTCVVIAALSLFSYSAHAQQLASSPRSAIDPVSVSPDKYKILLENDYIRVVEYSIKPGERDQTHTHPPKASYTLEGGMLRIVPAEGASFVDTTKAGDASWSGERPKHFAENVGTTPVRIVLFEVKEVKDRAPVAAEDRALLAPEDVTVKLANDSVRMMEVVLPPGLKEKPHTHPAYVTYVLSGGKVRIHAADGSARDSEFKTGAVFFSERVNHWAEVTGDTTIRVLLVEIRRP